MDRTGAPVVAGGTIESASPERTFAIGHALGRAARPGSVLALVGELGAGKTILTKGVADGLGVTSVVNSPTFVLMNEHPGRLRLYHIDAYRLEAATEAAEAGLLDERQADGVTVIEWADRLDGWLPADRLELTLAFGGDSERRAITWRAHGPAHEALASEALGAS
jgi:tRNA threonylcarbamoyladenosine biosynthesis protein TsaE